MINFSQRVDLKFMPSLWHWALLISAMLMHVIIFDGKANAEQNFKPLTMQSCFELFLAGRMTSLPLQDSEIRPLNFHFGDPMEGRNKRTELIEKSCKHHFQDEVNGFSKALFTLFEMNNVPLQETVSTKFRQTPVNKKGQVFWATFQVWLAAHKNENVGENAAYQLLTSLSDAGNGNASLQLHNFNDDVGWAQTTNVMIEKYFVLAAEQGNNFARNRYIYNEIYLYAPEGSEEERDSISQLLDNIKADPMPYEREYFLDICNDEYIAEKLPELNSNACAEAEQIVFPVADIENAKSALGSIFTKEQMQEAVDALISALSNDDKIYFNPEGDFTNRTQALILLSQVISLFNMTQIYEDAALEEALPKISEIMFDERTLIDKQALPFVISALLNLDYEELLDLSAKEFDLLNLYAEHLIMLNSDLSESCHDLSENQLYKNDSWPRDLPVLSALRIYSTTIEDFEDYADGEGLFQVHGELTMIDPSKIYTSLIKPDADISECNLYLSSKSVPLFPSELSDEMGIDGIVSFPNYIDIESQTGTTKLEKSILSYEVPSFVSWEFLISDKININPNLSNFPFQIGNENTGIVFRYAEIAGDEMWSQLVGDENYLLPPGSELETNSQQNNSIKTKLRSAESDAADLAIEISFDSEVNYYLLRIVFPSALFVMLSVLAVLAPSNKVVDLLSEAHLQVSTTVLVALVAYQFIIDSELPKLPYYTDLDIFLYCLLLSSSLSIVHNLLPHISSSQTKRFEYFSGVLKYSTIFFFVFALLDFAVKYFS